MSTDSIDRNALQTEADSLPADRIGIGVPFGVATGEAIDVARFARRYWDPVVDPATGRVVRPGLRFAGPKLPDDIADQILVLERMLSEAHRHYLLAAKPTVESPMTRAGFILRELKTVLGWHFDDAAANERDAQLERVQALHGAAMSQDAVAAALEAYAALAQTVRDELAEEHRFDVALIDEAPALAAELRERSAPLGSTDPTPLLLEKRNRLGALLEHRVGLVRSAARFVFRDCPEIVRQATSTYQRRQRTRRRTVEVPGEGVPTGTHEPVKAA